MPTHFIRFDSMLRVGQSSKVLSSDAMSSLLDCPTFGGSPFTRLYITVCDAVMRAALFADPFRVAVHTCRNVASSLTPQDVGGLPS